MSGGSWNYLCSKDVQDLIYSNELLERMSERLASLGYAEDAARETYELVQIIRQYKTKASVITDRLSDIWRAIEWWDSGDSGEDRVKAELVNYREKK